MFVASEFAEGNVTSLSPLRWNSTVQGNHRHCCQIRFQKLSTQLQKPNDASLHSWKHIVVWWIRSIFPRVLMKRSMSSSTLTGNCRWSKVVVVYPRSPGKWPILLLQNVGCVLRASLVLFGETSCKDLSSPIYCPVVEDSIRTASCTHKLIFTVTLRELL